MTSWLRKHSKADLAALAEDAGINVDASMRKDDIVDALDEHLQTNTTTLVKHPSFKEYFTSAARVRSPVKKEFDTVSNAVSTAADSVAKSVKRVKRLSKFPASDVDAETSPEPTVNSLLAHTPRAVQDLTSTLSLPAAPSPSAVTDLVERQAAIVTNEVNRYLLTYSVEQRVTILREALSTVSAIETGFLLFEAWGLQRATLPWKFVFDLPASKVSGGSSFPIHIPDFFVLLTSSFWGPTISWALTSLLVPMAIGWLFNFSLVHGKGNRGGYEIDPLVFSIAKMLITWLVYSQGARFYGLIPESSIHTIDSAVHGGWFGIVVGAGVSAVISLYSAVLRH